MTRKRLTASLVCALALLLGPSLARAQNVLLIWDDLTPSTIALSNALQGAGMSVTLSATNQNQWNGTNPSTSGFCAVIHLNGTTYANGMSVGAETALVSFVQNGGGFIGGEWNAYDLSIGLRANMRDLILFDRESGTETTLTYTDVPAQSGHPILANVPSTFSFFAGANIGPLHVFGVDPATTLMTDQNGSAAVAVRNFGFGRVVNFNHAGNYNFDTALSDPNVQQLYIDAVRFTCGCGNGTLDPGETCDDGNQTNGDGCSSSCAIEPCVPPCADQIACTDDVCQFDSPTAAFVCVHNPINGQCNDHNDCTDDLCDTQTGCTNPVDNANQCSDGDACTIGDHCVAGACAGGGPRVCNDGNPCTDDFCSTATGCFVVNNQAPCDDHNACTDTDTCSGFGFCQGTPNTLPCDDGNQCTVGEHCQSGFCGFGAPVTCDDHNPCTTDFCSSFQGCVHLALQNGLFCEDNNPCTTDDTCQGGFCVGDPRNCADGNPCTVDSCSSAGGAFLCLHESCTGVPDSFCPTPQCQPATCGNNQVDPGETCDPPDATPKPGHPGQVTCRADCTSCGDAITQPNDGETCDDGNLVTGCDPLHPTRPLDPCQTSCAPPICQDPARIRFANGVAVFDVHGRIEPVPPALTIDPSTATFVVELTDEAGATLFRRSLEAGVIVARGRGFKYVDRAAKLNGGISRLKFAPRGTSYRVTLTAYGDAFTAAPEMTTHLYIGAQQWTLRGTWLPTKSGWQLDPRSSLGTP